MLNGSPAKSYGMDGRYFYQNSCFICFSSYLLCRISRTPSLGGTFDGVTESLYLSIDSKAVGHHAVMHSKVSKAQWRVQHCAGMLFTMGPTKVLVLNCTMNSIPTALLNINTNQYFGVKSSAESAPWHQKKQAPRS